MIDNIAEYAARRRKLLAALPDHAIALVPGNSLDCHNHHAYPFRQNSDFYYLTGLNEPGHLLVLHKYGSEQHNVYMCSPEPDSNRLQWEGHYLSCQEVAAALGLDQAFSVKQAHNVLTESCQAAEYVYLPGALSGKTHHAWQPVQQLVPAFTPKDQTEIIDLTPLIHHMRRIKTPMELRLLQKAADISIAAHQIVMQKCRSGLFEYQLQAEFFPSKSSLKY